MGDTSSGGGGGLGGFIGAMIGMAKGIADENARENDQKRSAAEARYSPWTGMKPDKVRSANILGSTLQGLTGMGAADQNAGKNSLGNQVTDAGKSIWGGVSNLFGGDNSGMVSQGPGGVDQTGMVSSPAGDGSTLAALKMDRPDGGEGANAGAVDVNRGVANTGTANYPSSSPWAKLRQLYPAQSTLDFAGGTKSFGPTGSY